MAAIMRQGASAVRGWRRQRPGWGTARLALLLAVLLLPLLPAGIARASTSWTTLSPNMAGVHDLAGTVSAPCPTSNSAHTCVYVIGGTDGGSGTDGFGNLNTVEYFDTTTSGGWNTLSATLQTARSGLGAAAAPCPTSTDTCIYAIGGRGEIVGSTAYLTSVEYFDPEAGGSWAYTATLNTGRDQFGATAAPCPNSTDTCLWALGGSTSSATPLGSVEWYDPEAGGATWTTHAQGLQTPRTGLAAAVAPCSPPESGKTCLYAIGGEGSGGPATAMTSVEQWPIAPDNVYFWSTFGHNLTVARGELSATVAACPSGPDTCIYAVGGVDTSNLGRNTAEYYDATTAGGWTAFSATLNAARDGEGTAAAPCPAGTDTCLYAVGGETRDCCGITYQNTVEYDDISRWNLLSPPLNAAREDQGSTAAPCPSPSIDTCIYAIGGQNTSADSSVLNTAEYYDPTTNSGWTQLGATLGTARDELGAAAAPCPPPTTGHTCLYAIGGSIGTPASSTDELNTVEYTDLTGGAASWSTLGATLLIPRRLLAAVAAPCPTSSDTCLYAIGGFNSTDGILTSVEYFDPKSSPTPATWTALSASLGTARQALGAAAAPCPSSTHTCLYAIGGDGSSGVLNTAEFVDPTAGASTWNAIPGFLNTARDLLGAVSAPCPSPSGDTCVYAIGGNDGSSPVTGTLPSSEYADPQAVPYTGWHILPASFNTPRDLGVATAACPSNGDACLYAIGGANTATPLNTVEFFDTGRANPPVTTRALIGAFTAARHGATVRFQWRAAHASGIVGFALYAGTHRLAPGLIPVHRSPLYHAVVHHAPPGPYTLAAILADGTRQTSRARSG